MHRFAFPGRRPALGTAVRGTLLSVALAAALPLPAARAAEPAAAAQPRAYAIAPGPMGDVLAVFAATAGVSLSFDPALLAGLRSQGLQGRFAVREGFERLLRGTAFEAAGSDAAGYTLRRRAVPPATPTAEVPAAVEATLPAVRVSAAAAPAAPGTFARRGEPAPVEPGLVPAQRIENYGASDLEDVFASQPEVAVGGGHGIAQKVFVRGMEDTLLNVTVDGASQSGQTFHHAGRIQIEPELIRQVEVGAGTGDATAGAGALGGSLRFVTKDPQDLLRPGERAGALLKGNYFSNGEGFKTHGSVFTRLSSDWAGMLAFTHQKLGDYEDGDGRRVDHTGSRQQLAFLKLVGHLDGGHSLRLGHERKRDEGERTQRPQWVASSFNRAYPLESERATWTFGYGWQPGNPLVDLALTLYQTETDIEQNVVDRWGIYHGKVDTTGFDLRNTSRFGAHELTYGVDYARDAVRAGPSVDPSAEREDGSVAGLYAQGGFALSDDLALSAGARYDRYRLTHITGAQLGANGFSPNASLRYTVVPGVTLLAGHARALRGARVRDAFKLESVAGIAPDLQPERARTTELGFEIARGAWRFNGKAYHTTVRDAVADTVARPVVYENVGDLKSRGVLLHLAGSWRDLRVGIGLHHNKSTVDGRPLNGYEHNGLGTSQGDTLTGSVEYRLSPRIEWGWTGRLVRRIDSLDTGVGTISKPGYGVHDLYATWRPTASDDLRVSLIVKNLFDKSYLDHGTTGDFQHIAGYEGIVGSREPGRELRLGLALRF